MTFAKKLNKLMSELNLTQSKVSQLTGITKSAISQYVAGKHEPSKARQQEIARALGVEETYFEVFDPVVIVQENVVVNLPIALVARLMGKSKDFITKGLQDGVFPWGYAVKLKKWSFFISSVKFTEHTGIQVPILQSMHPYKCDNQQN